MSSADNGSIGLVIASEDSRDRMGQPIKSLLQMDKHVGEDTNANANVRAVFRNYQKAKRRRLRETGMRALGRGIELQRNSPGTRP